MRLVPRAAGRGPRVAGRLGRMLLDPEDLDDVNDTVRMTVATRAGAGAGTGTGTGAVATNR